MKCIQLLAITKSSVLQAYGANCILENFMKGVKQLEQVCITGHIRNVLLLLIKSIGSVINYL